MRTTDLAGEGPDGPQWRVRTTRYRLEGARAVEVASTQSGALGQADLERRYPELTNRELLGGCPDAESR